MHAKVTENIQQHRFELPITSQAFAVAYYTLQDGKVALIHTEVPSEFSGQGIASRLAQGTFELLRKTGRKAVLKCPFMSGFVAKHPEYTDVVAG
ncbi:GNAT family N-acetyltransferase [Mesorhizobium salmacidum]|uniref:GNAT family N-acetyltransferase n=1 Tax=Mesorhizobium salmacidum TaxID=3015171 RepID=A0ABU8L359_9HYPH